MFRDFSRQDSWQERASSQKEFDEQNEILSNTVRRHHEGVDMSEPGVRDSDPPRPGRRDLPRAYSLGKRTFLLGESELTTMAELGTFRVVAASDLAHYVYSDDARRMERDLRRLKAQELVLERTLPVSGRKTLRVLALTKLGKRTLRNSKNVPEDQEIYHGIVKPREAKHDAELYRLFQAEAARIESTGGRPLRVQLDYELQRALNCERSRLGDQRSDPQEIARLAGRHGLNVVDGKIPIPDMRIEYQTAEFEIRRVDLELTTSHYRPCAIAEKARAGFSLYGSREDATRLSRILDEQELRARIRTL